MNHELISEDLNHHFNTFYSNVVELTNLFNTVIFSVIFVVMKTSCLMGNIFVILFYSIFRKTQNPNDSDNDKTNCVICLDEQLTTFAVRCARCTFVACFPCVQMMQDNKCPQCRGFIHLKHHGVVRQRRPLQ
jgi:hypothetical protein